MNNSEEAMDDYYRLHCMTRKRQGVPPQPVSFFKNIFDFIVKQGKGNIFFAAYE